jgi:hypothetical protein
MRSPSNQFITEVTLDGSPTLRSLQAGTGSAVPESMHHTASAAGETEYVYGEALRRAQNTQIQSLNFLIVGLGLGYIEMLILSQMENCKINSYESDPELRLHFWEWISNPNSEFEIYNEVCKHLKINSGSVRSQFRKNDLILNEKLSLQSKFTELANVICFDAFSKKSSESLWTEEFLNYFLTHACAQDCIFVTYSCTSLLKRVLTAHGFQLLPRLGFEGKRDSTLAVRGVFSKAPDFE